MRNDTAVGVVSRWRISEVAVKRSRPAWKRHELVSKAIFEALLKQSNAENLEVKHNVCIKGLKTCHQIDVFWKFRMGGVDHLVIVQVKKKKERAKKVNYCYSMMYYRISLGNPEEFLSASTAIKRVPVK